MSLVNPLRESLQESLRESDLAGKYGPVFAARFCPELLEGSGRIWKDLEGSGRIWKDPDRLTGSRCPVDPGGFGQVPENRKESLRIGLESLKWSWGDSEYHNAILQDPWQSLGIGNHRTGGYGSSGNLDSSAVAPIFVENPSESQMHLTSILQRIWKPPDVILSWSLLYWLNWN